jgi:ACS family hexuronate transporter-like MFS transporter
MMLVSTISYVDRNTLALLIPTIRAETGLSAEQYGWIVSAFSIAYMLGNPGWGALLDRIGVRVGMTAAVGWWSAAAAHAWAGSFGSFAALRFALGFGEGATFPGALRTVQQTLPPDRRGRGIAISYSGGALGAFLTPILMTPVAAWLGWRGAFLFTGLLGAAWLAWWLHLSRDPALKALPPEPSGARLDFRDPRLWGALASYSMGAVPLGFVLYNASLYLTARFGVSQVGLGGLLWIPPAGWEVGYIFWGWMCDRVGVANVGKLMRVAMVFSLPLAIAPRVDSLPLLMLQLFFAMFMTSGFIIPSINYATHIVPKGATSLVAGLGAGSFSLLTAILAPVFGRFFDQGRYDAAFALAALFPVMGYAAFRAANRARA